MSPSRKPSTKTYIAIDLKSFYASVECVERGLDPMTTNLVGVPREMAIELFKPFVMREIVARDIVQNVRTMF